MTPMPGQAFTLVHGLRAALTARCRLVSRLTSDRRERRLRPLERLAWWGHLVGCRSCRRFHRGLETLERAAPHVPIEVPATRLSDAARRRIAARLGESAT